MCYIRSTFPYACNILSLLFHSKTICRVIVLLFLFVFYQHESMLGCHNVMSVCFVLTELNPIGISVRIFIFFTMQSIEIRPSVLSHNAANVFVVYIVLCEHSVTLHFELSFQHYKSVLFLRIFMQFVYYCISTSQHFISLFLLCTRVFWIWQMCVCLRICNYRHCRTNLLLLVITCAP